MPHGLKKIIENIMPPILFGALKSKYGSYGFSGHYTTWAEAKEKSGGYDSEGILCKVKESLLKVKSGEAAYERDSVLFDEIQYSWPLLAALLWVSSRHQNRLNLVDFGGSLGSSYFQNKPFMDHLNELKWNIVEQKHFVDCGKCHFEDKNLNFYYDLAECKKVQSPNVILFLSVIQYIENPYELLQEVIGHEFQYIIFDRTTFVEEGESRIVIQKVSSKINEASYPLWFFNCDEFINFFKKNNYELIAHFKSMPDGNVIPPVFKGYIFKRVASDVR